jgi:hypothetical protein
MDREFLSQSLYVHIQRASFVAPQLLKDGRPGNDMIEMFDNEPQNGLFTLGEYGYSPIDDVST